MLRLSAGSVTNTKQGCGRPFDGGRLSSDGGLLALREIESRLGLADRLAACLKDRRAPERVVPPVGRDHPLSHADDRHRLWRRQRCRLAACRPDRQLRDRWFADSSVEEAVLSELVL